VRLDVLGGARGLLKSSMTTSDEKRSVVHNVRFGLKTLFLFLTATSFWIWGIIECYQERYGHFLIAAALAIIPLHWYAITRGYSPILVGPIAGLVSFGVSLVGFSVVFGSGYFFYDGVQEYFEDGAATMLLFFPIMFFLYYGPYFLAIGWIYGAIISGARSLIRATRN